jgi:hypothetical protein
MGPTLAIVFVAGMLIGLPIAILMGVAGLSALIVDGRFVFVSAPQRFLNGVNSFPLLAVMHSQRVVAI